MIIVQICVGSSCHLKGSEQLVQLCQQAIAQGNLQDSVGLGGSFCTGKCNREGVTVTVHHQDTQEIVTGVRPEGFQEFWNTYILSKLR